MSEQVNIARNKTTANHVSTAVSICNKLGILAAFPVTSNSYLGNANADVT